MNVIVESQINSVHKDTSDRYFTLIKLLNAQKELHQGITIKCLTGCRALIESYMLKVITVEPEKEYIVSTQFNSANTQIGDANTQITQNDNSKVYYILINVNVRTMKEEELKNDNQHDIIQLIFDNKVVNTISIDRSIKLSIKKNVIGIDVYWINNNAERSINQSKKEILNGNLYGALTLLNNVRYYNDYYTTYNHHIINHTLNSIDKTITDLINSIHISNNET